MGMYFARHIYEVGCGGSNFLPPVFIKIVTASGRGGRVCVCVGGELRPQTQHYSYSFRVYTFNLKKQSRKLNHRNFRRFMFPNDCPLRQDTMVYRIMSSR